MLKTPSKALCRWNCASFQPSPEENVSSGCFYSVASSFNSPSIPLTRLRIVSFPIGRLVMARSFRVWPADSSRKRLGYIAIYCIRGK